MGKKNTFIEKVKHQSPGMGTPDQELDPIKWAESFMLEHNLMGASKSEKENIIQWFDEALKSGYRKAYFEYAERD